MRILFAPAAGPEAGGGHVMRCLSLAEALAARGCDCAFGAAAQPIVARFGSRAFSLFDGQSAGGFDAVVVDDYGVAAEGEAALRAQAPVLMAIDDLGDRPHLADLLLDPGYGRTPEDYAGLVPEGAQLLLGPSYALLRRGFIGRRARAGDPVERLFVSFGLSDVGGIAGRATKRLAALGPELTIDVALSSGAQSLPMLQRFAAQHPQVKLHVDHPDVAELMAAADLAVGAGGVGVWERACLGLPSLAVIVADNQGPLIERLARDGALLGVEDRGGGGEDAIYEAAARLLQDPGLRTGLAAKALGLCDGRGAERAADALVAQISRLSARRG